MVLLHGECIGMGAALLTMPPPPPHLQGYERYLQGLLVRSGEGLQALRAERERLSSPGSIEVIGELEHELQALGQVRGEEEGGEEGGGDICLVALPLCPGLLLQQPPVSARHPSLTGQSSAARPARRGPSPGINCSCRCRRSCQPFLSGAQ